MIYERSFICKDCSASYIMTYQTSLGAANAHRTRCPKCQKAREHLLKHKKASQIDFQETKTDNSTMEIQKNPMESAFIEPKPSLIEETRPEAEIRSVTEPQKPESKSKVDDPLLSSMGKRIRIYPMWSDEKTSLQNAVVYGRSYRKEQQ